MSRIRQNLLRIHRQSGGVEEVDETGDDKASKREEEERSRSRRQLTTSLAEFQEKLHSLAATLPPGTDRAAALCMWFEVTLPILLQRLQEPDEAELFMKRWLTCVMTGQRTSNSSDILCGHVLSSLLALTSIELQRASDSGRQLGRLHEQIEAFCEGASPVALTDEMELLDPAQPPQAAGILKFLPSAPSLWEARAAVLSTPTPCQQLEKISEACRNGTGISSEIPILELSAARDFATQAGAGRIPKILPISASATACPHCHMKISRGKMADIERDRFGCCSNCSRFLIATI